MVSSKLVITSGLYLFGRYLLSFVSKKLPTIKINTDGDREGPLIHRFTTIKKTVNGTATDVTFHYVESLNSAQECIVFLHGFPDSWKLWEQQLKLFSNHYHVVALDLKGCGQSSKNYPQKLFSKLNDPGGNYDLEMQADEIVSALKNIGVKKFNLITLDLGTIIGDLLAGKHSDCILRYVRCQQPLIGHFLSSIPQGSFLRARWSARIGTTLLEADPSSLIRIVYGRTGWPRLDNHMKRTKVSLGDDLLTSSVQEISYPFKQGPRKGRPGAFVCAITGLYQHNQSYIKYLRNNLDAYQNYRFPVILIQGIYDLAMPSYRFDGTTGMAFKWSRPFGAQKKRLTSRPFFSDGRGLEDGYEPWGELLPGCTHPLPVQALFPNAPSIELKFMNTGHYPPIEAPDEFNRLLREALLKER